MREGCLFARHSYTHENTTVPQQSASHCWTERFPLARLPFAGDLAVAAAASGAAFLLRLLIADHLPPGFAFLTFFPAVILTAFTLGTRAGAMAAIFCGLLT